MCAGSCYRLGFMLACLGGLQIQHWNVDHDGDDDNDDGMMIMMVRIMMTVMLMTIQKFGLHLGVSGRVQSLHSTHLGLDFGPKRGGDHLQFQKNHCKFT